MNERDRPRPLPQSVGKPEPDIGGCPGEGAWKVSRLGGLCDPRASDPSRRPHRHGEGPNAGWGRGATEGIPDAHREGVPVGLGAKVMAVRGGGSLAWGKKSVPGSW
jgi:hypothetical protein